MESEEVPMLRSCDPRIFGPPTWKMLHILAANYPDRASPRIQKHCCRFLFSLSHLLPCPRCGSHFRGYLRSNNLKRCVEGRERLIPFLVEAHNEISKHTRPNQPAYDSSCAQREYARMRAPYIPLPQLWSEPSKKARASPSPASCRKLSSGSDRHKSSTN